MQLSNRLHKFLTAPVANAATGRIRFWLSLALTFSVFYSLLGLQVAFSGEYIVQDDARQHVFWMQRFLDPDLFPNDIIADYFASVAPAGYTAVYRLPAFLGVDPLFFNKLLPPILGLVASAYCFGTCLQILPIPSAAFAATLLLNQNFWMRDDLVSGTAVAFVSPLFLAFLYYLLRSSLLGVGIAIALLGLFYPQAVLIAVGVLVLRLLRWEGKRLHFGGDRSDFRLCAVGLGVALAVLLPYGWQSSEFGAIVTATEARGLQDFSDDGWSSFFFDNPFEFWLCGKRSGIFPSEWCYLSYKDWPEVERLPLSLRRYFPFKIPYSLLALLLPLFLKFNPFFPAVKHLRKKGIVLPQILLVSVFLFFASHALLFKLHLPNRYTEHTFRIVASMAAGFAIVIILDALFRVCKNRFQKLAATTVTFFFCAFLVGYPHALERNKSDFPFTVYHDGDLPQLYEFLQQQPKDIIIASIEKEVNDIPTFAKRSIFVGADGYTLPYHKEYYAEIQQRTQALIQAQYNPSLMEVQQFIKKYGIDFWLIDLEAFTPKYVSRNDWMQQHGELRKAIKEKLKQGMIPALSGYVDGCSVLAIEELVVLPSDCILEAEL